MKASSSRYKVFILDGIRIPRYCGVSFFEVLVGSTLTKRMYGTIDGTPSGIYFRGFVYRLAGMFAFLKNVLEDIEMKSLHDMNGLSNKLRRRKNWIGVSMRGFSGQRSGCFLGIHRKMSLIAFSLYHERSRWKINRPMKCD